MALQKTVFGRVKYKPNTFIGGVAGTINTPALLAPRLNLDVKYIKSFKVVGNDIECAVIVNYSVGWYQWRDNPDLTYYKDYGGRLVSIAG
jgi:hypothetical protein